MSNSTHPAPPPRSSGALKGRRVPLPWPPDRDFRILAVDGGGIRGVFPAAFLAGLEDRYLGGSSVAGYFDLIAGTSTGGIIAVGLGAGLKGADLRELYVERGREVFPPLPANVWGRLRHRWRCLTQLVKYRYDREVLAAILSELLGDRTLADSHARLCVPAFEGRHGEVYIFKTPHHPDYILDAKEPMTKVALATAAAPTFYRPLEDGGYTFVDGGVWAGNPVMIALVDALSCFNVPRDRIRILSLGCGDDPYVVHGPMIESGGMWHWRKVICGAMRLQSLNATGQAGLLLGADRVHRIDAPTSDQKIQMDDWRRAVDLLPAAAEQALAHHGAEIAAAFLSQPADPYMPLVT